MVDATCRNNNFAIGSGFALFCRYQSTGQIWALEAGTGYDIAGLDPFPSSRLFPVTAPYRRPLQDK